MPPLTFSFSNLSSLAKTGGCMKKSIGKPTRYDAVSACVVTTSCGFVSHDAR